MKTAPWGAVLVGVGAIALILYRVLSGNWTMGVVVGIGVVGALAALALWWLWDRRTFGQAIRTLSAVPPDAVVVGGYLVAADFRNETRGKPPLGEVVIQADSSGLTAYDLRRRPPESVLTVAWTHIIDVSEGEGSFLGEQRPALVVLTLEGRLVVVLRGDERRGIISAGDVRTGSLVARIRALRGPAPAGGAVISE